MGELWALPIMLRIGLIENLRRICTRIAIGRRHQDLADDWAERMIDAVENRPTDLVLVLADMIRANPPLSGAFVTELVRHLQGQSPHFAFANGWLEQRLTGIGTTIERLVLAEGQEQATDQVSMSNSIASLRFLGSYDWRDFVEEQSVVEQVLRSDPSGHYPKMDFTTRDQYRHAVEQISRHSRFTEVEIARLCIQKPRRVPRRLDLITTSTSANSSWAAVVGKSNGRQACRRLWPCTWRRRAGVSH